MNSGLLIAVCAGLGGMLGWGFADFFAKKTIDKIGDVTTLFWGQLIGIVPLAILFVFNPSVPVLGSGGVFFLIILGIWSGLSYIPAYVAFGKGKVSLLSPIFASWAVIVAILSGVFLKEVIPLDRIVIFFIVFIGVLLISGDPRSIWKLITRRGDEKTERVKGLPEILLAVVLYSLWLIALDLLLVGRNWVPLLLVIRIFSALSIFIYAKIAGKKITFTDKSLWKYLICIGVFDVAAFSFVSYGFSATPYVSVVAMLSGAFSVPTIILARIFLKEKATRLQTIGTIIVIAGVVLLYLL